MQGDLSTTLKKFPVQPAHPGAGRKPGSLAPSSSLCGTLRFRSGGHRGDDSAWTYLELQASRAPVAFHAAPAFPIPLRFLHPQPHSPGAGGSANGVLASPKPSATSLAGQPHPGAPAWVAGWAQLSTVDSLGPDSHGQGSGAPGASALGALSAAPRSAWVGGSQFSRLGCRGGAHACPLLMPGVLFTLFSSCPEAEAHS